MGRLVSRRPAYELDLLEMGESVALALDAAGWMGSLIFDGSEDQTRMAIKWIFAEERARE